MSVRPAFIQVRNTLAAAVAAAMRDTPTSDLNKRIDEVLSKAFQLHWTITEELFEKELNGTPSREAPSVVLIKDGVVGIFVGRRYYVGTDRRIYRINRFPWAFCVVSDPELSMLSSGV